MHYECGVGSYVNDDFETILETGLYFDVPYKVDREKYDFVLRKHGEEPRVKDADVLVFCMQCSMDDDNTPYHHAFFCFPQNSPKDSDDFYECVLFNGDREEFEDFVNEFVDCVLGISEEHVKELKEEKEHRLSVIDQQIMFLETLLKETK